MNRRRGYSLIEILVVIATGAAMMGVALGLLGMLIRLEQASRREVQEETVMNRLADQFRRDVHAADRLAVASAPGVADLPPVWQFPLEAGHVVEYRAEQGELVRIERRDDKVLKQESFSLPAEARVSIDPAGDALPGIVSLRIAGTGIRPPGPAWRGARVDAELAKDRRFVKQKQP